MKASLLWLVLLLILSAANAGEWYPGIIHLHSSCSDGANDPHNLALLVQKQIGGLRADGKCFMIVTDHFDWIERPGSLVTYRIYPELVRQESINGRFIAIPGLEVGSKWHPEPGNVASSHTLALGELFIGYFMSLQRFFDDKEYQTPNFQNPLNPITLNLKEQDDRQIDIANAIASLKMIPIVAHPSLLTLGGGSIARTDNRYDMRPGKYSSLGGVEMWNVTNSNQNEECVNFYLRLIAEGQKVIVTSGSDYHGGIQTALNGVVGDPLKRVTWVWAEKFDRAAIITAMGNGSTYAADEGAYFLDLKPVPSKQIIINADPIISGLVFAPGDDDRRLTIYRNGSLADSFKVKGEKSITGSRYNFSWRDVESTEKTNNYVVRVEDILITSPIYFKRETEVASNPATANKSDFDQIKVDIRCIKDLVKHQDGNFLASCDDGYVRKITPAGQILTKWQGLGRDRDDKPSTIDVDKEGNVYTFWGRSDESSCISKSDQEGKLIAKLNLGRSDYSFFWFPTPTFSISPSGLIYWFNGTNVLRVYSRDGQKTREISIGHAVSTVGAVSGLRSELLGNPTGLNMKGPVVDDKGNIFVIAHEMVDIFYDVYWIVKFDPNGGTVKRWGHGGGVSGQDWTPFSLALDSIGNLFVTDKSNHTVELYSNQGALIKAWDLTKSIKEKFGLFGASGPFCVTIDHTNCVYITIETSDDQTIMLELK